MLRRSLLLMLKNQSNCIFRHIGEDLLVFFDSDIIVSHKTWNQCYYNIIHLGSVRCCLNNNEVLLVENESMDTSGKGRLGTIERLGLTHMYYWYYV